MTSLLKHIGLAAGIRRAGGLRPADLAQDDLKKEANRAKEEHNGVAVDGKAEGESAYYDYFADLVREWEGGFEPVVLGVKQVGSGEWSTPDVLAVSVVEAPSLVFPIVRIVTVEVKACLSRSAIAEACAHRRFSHYSYIGVPLAPSEMDSALVTELAQANLGLICPRQKGSLTFQIHVDAPFHRPDEEEIEATLARFKNEEGRCWSDVVREKTRKAMRVLFSG